MQNVGLDEAQAGIKIAGRNNNNLRYSDDKNGVTKSQTRLRDWTELNWPIPLTYAKMSF